MTVSELRVLLMCRDADQDDLPVLVRGYEGGYKDLIPEYIGVRTVVFDYREPGYMGPHDLHDEVVWDEDDVKDKRIGPALIIDREGK